MIVLFLSLSLSLTKTSLTDPSVTVIVLSVDISIVLLSFEATGASLIPVIVKVIWAISNAFDPAFVSSSITLYENTSVTCWPAESASVAAFPITL